MFVVMPVTVILDHYRMHVLEPVGHPDSIGGRMSANAIFVS